MKLGAELGIQPSTPVWDEGILDSKHLHLKERLVIEYTVHLWHCSMGEIKLNGIKLFFRLLQDLQGPNGSHIDQQEDK